MNPNNGLSENDILAIKILYGNCFPCTFDIFGEKKFF